MIDYLNTVVILIRCKPLKCSGHITCIYISPIQMKEVIYWLRYNSVCADMLVDSDTYSQMFFIYYWPFGHNKKVWVLQDSILCTIFWWLEWTEMQGFSPFCLVFVLYMYFFVCNFIGITSNSNKNVRTNVWLWVWTVKPLIGGYTG